MALMFSATARLLKADATNTINMMLSPRQRCTGMQLSAVDWIWICHSFEKMCCVTPGPAVIEPRPSGLLVELVGNLTRDTHRSPTHIHRQASANAQVQFAPPHKC